jgi:hypothetical protein
MRYDPRRGGHAPGHLRDWLYQYITGEFDQYDPPQISLERLTGVLWNCVDDSTRMTGCTAPLFPSLGDRGPCTFYQYQPGHSASEHSLRW